MIIPRTYKPSADDILWHYCTPEAFLAVCSNKTIRFSDVFAMNDFMEMHWGYSVWEEVATELRKDLGSEFVDAVDAVISVVPRRALPLIACFSANSDVLSQWRGYAADGAGYCIGFRASHLCEFPIRPLRVAYDRDKQKEELSAIVRELSNIHSEDKGEEEFFRFCAAIGLDLLAFKNPAFREEEELRLAHIVEVADCNESARLVGCGGTRFGEPCDTGDISFTMRGSVPVAHTDMPLLGPDGSHPIVEVVIGPKNRSLPSAVSIFLETLEIDKVKISKSKASYR